MSRLLHSAFMTVDCPIRPPSRKSDGTSILETSQGRIDFISVYRAFGLPFTCPLSSTSKSYELFTRSLLQLGFCVLWHGSDRHILSTFPRYSSNQIFLPHSHSSIWKNRAPSKTMNTFIRTPRLGTKQESSLATFTILIRSIALTESFA